MATDNHPGVTIYHNARCSKSREALGLVRDAGIEPEIVEYLKTPLDTAQLRRLFAGLGLTDVRDAMRRGEKIYKDLKLGAETVDQEQLIKAIAANPILLERAIVVGPKGSAVCRPPEIATTLI